MVTTVWGVLGLISSGRAACPSDVSIAGALSCSSTISGSIDHTAESLLGGECDDGGCYVCGEPFDEQAQIAPEEVYSFSCQQSGEVVLRISDLPCDLDIYVLDESCDPYLGCVQGSTASYAEDDSVTFTCTAGALYYISIEAYGTRHLDIASGPCTSDGTSAGEVYSPSYTLFFDVSESTGCPEDCNDGEDNDLDGDFDCDDKDCGADVVCCDLDEDGFFSEDCGGPDCDDEDPDINPDAYDVPGDGIDQDCSGADAQEPEPEDTGPTDDGGGDDDSGLGGDGDGDGDAAGDVVSGGGDEPRSCACASNGDAGGGGMLLWLGAMALAVIGRRRRG